jgi:hypothetical protein
MTFIKLHVPLDGETPLQAMHSEIRQRRCLKELRSSVICCVTLKPYTYTVNNTYLFMFLRNHAHSSKIKLHIHVL